MPRLILTPGAVRGLERCRRFLEDKSQAAARRAAAAIRRHLTQLESSPEIGRPFADPPLRELVIPFGDAGYVALYRHEPSDDAVYVLTFRHQREAGYPPSNRQERRTASRRFGGRSARARRPRGVPPRTGGSNPRAPAWRARNCACQGAGRRARICRRTNPRSECGGGAPDRSNQPVRYHTFPELHPHHHPSGRRPADLVEPRRLEHALRAEAHLAPGHVPPDLPHHRIALERPRPARPREADRGPGERSAHPLPPEARPHEEAGHRPDPRVRLVLRPPDPGHAVDPEQPRIGGARLDRAPADRLGAAERHQPARRPLPAPRLRPQPLGADVGRMVLERLAGRELVALAEADRPLPARAEDRGEFLPPRLVRRHHPDPVAFHRPMLPARRIRV